MGKASNLTVHNVNIENVGKDIFEELDRLILRAKVENRALEQLLKKINHTSKSSTTKQNNTFHMQFTQTHELPFIREKRSRKWPDRTRRRLDRLSIPTGAWP